MTLIFSGVTNKSVVMTCDSRIVKRMIDAESLEYIRTVSTFDLGENDRGKIVRLSDYVLLGCGGSRTVGDLLVKMMLQRTSPQYDIAKCETILRDCIEELQEIPEFERFFQEKSGFGCILSGLYQEKGSAQITFSSPDAFSRLDVPKGLYTWAKAMVPPPFSNGDYSLEGYFDILTRLPGNGSANRKNINLGFVQAHAVMSYLADNSVSPDCTVYCLERKGMKVKFYQDKTDTSVLYKGFPDKDEFKRELDEIAKSVGGACN